MRVTYYFNGGPGRTRTYDQGIMSDLDYGPWESEHVRGQFPNNMKI